MLNVLIAESDRLVRKELVRSLSEKSCNINRASDTQGLQLLLEQPADWLVLDSKLLAGDTELFLEKLKERRSALKIILTIPENELPLVSQKSREVLAALITRPFSIDLIVETILTPAQNDEKPLGEGEKSPYFDIEQFPSIKRHPGMKRALGLLRHVAGSDMTVLIMGESGVGKESFARSLHQWSTRAHKSMMALNCASIPGNLLEVELFGCEKGAYTGANTKRIGRCEHAQGGTLFLDEISEMDLGLQSKLLRVIQEKEIYRIGGVEKINLDVRLISATNRDLKKWVSDGQFREDLFYRLNVIAINIPPLRERTEDIPCLAEHFIKSFNRQNPGRNLKVGMEAIEQLCQYDWPGNLRELENIIVRSAYLCKTDELKKIFFDEQRSQLSDDAQFVLGGTIAEMERKMIYNALELHDGNRVRASASLGISVRTLRNKLKQYREESQQGHALPVGDTTPDDDDSFADSDDDEKFICPT